MRRRRFRALAAGALSSILVACAAGAVQGPPARPGEEVTTWVRMEQGFPGQSIYFRNNTDRAMVIDAVEIHDCMNLGQSACRYFTPELVLGPRATVEFITLLPANRDRPYRFAYRYNFRELE